VARRGYDSRHVAQNKKVVEAFASGS
jgi:hypothetical protein